MNNAFSRIARVLCGATIVWLAASSGITGCASGGDATNGAGGSAAADSGLDSGGTGGGSSGSGGTSGTSGTSGSGGTSGSAGATGGAAGVAGAAGIAGAAGLDGGGDADADLDAQAGAAGADADASSCDQIPEVCNGLDDNCNGVIDENNPGGGAPCQVPGKQGACADGVMTCTNGVLLCVSQNQPSNEICNGIDDNCNGTVDEGNPGGGQQCPTGLLGVCAYGTSKCVSGTLECQQNVQSSTEVCNGLDDDCNGTVDDGFAGAGQPCTVTDPPGLQGPCQTGQTTCNGQSQCAQSVFATPEVCDGKDNDCNGSVDDGLNGFACSTGLKGVCATGKTQCTGGAQTCVPDFQPNTQQEVCDGKDNNCDGTVDDVPNIALECATKNPSAKKVYTWGCTVGYCSILQCVSGFGDCDNTPGDGCESDLSSDVSNCGTCGNPCDTTHGAPYCVASQCKIVCDAGYGNCDNNANNGCEDPISADLNNCGACGLACTNSHGTTTCTAGACKPTCSAGWGDCDGDASNGCETNLNSSTNHCGTCGTVCTNANGSTSCSNGVCSPVCVGGANCNGNVVDGCEVNTLSDINNCGACNTKCVNSNGTTTCTAGLCVPSCSSGSADCNSNPVDGCETNTNTSTNNCGTCGTKCTNSHGTTSCVTGTCAPLCQTGYASCDGDPSNGCEANTNTDTSNCGGCGTTCTNANGGVSCAAGVCVPSCTSGYASCDGDPKNGCETNTTSDVNNCGACAKQCQTTNATSTSCQAGVCAPVCASGWKDCDGNPANGCETHTSIDTDNCGSCGHVCPTSGGTASCSNGVCSLACSAGLADCDNNGSCETNILTSNGNCGGCGLGCQAVNGSNSCVAGTCTPICLSGYSDCDGNHYNGCETNTQTSKTNCGGCGLSCQNVNGTNTCSGGSCSSVCSLGYGDCDSNGYNGCETNTNTDASHCGNCATACQQQGGTNVCSGGGCVPSCNAGYGNCDSNPTNGCETDLTSTTAHCGSCSIACTNANGSTSCVGGACSPACNSPYLSCDGNANNGCETNTSTDPLHCGSCAKDCTASPPPNTTGEGCSGSACTITGCTAGTYNQNGTFADGCECTADPGPNTCGSAQDAGTIGVDATATVTGNLVPAGDQDWYKVTFASASVCNYGPKIAVTTNGGPIIMHVYTSCTTGGMSCSVAETGDTSKAAGITTWDFNYTSACGGLGSAIDATDPAFLQAPFNAPLTLWVQVIATGTTNTCLPYTLTFSN